MKKRVFLLLLALALLFSVHALAVSRGVYYEIFVRSYADSNGDGIGDLNGLTQKLDYLSSLDVKGIWLMPVFPSPSYHGYDVTDYRSINPDYGTMADFEAFLAAAHERGMKVLLDIPFNHTSSEHPWFIESKDPASDKRNWYHWADETTAGVNLKQSVWGSDVWKKSESGWYYALFWEGMPDLNFETTAVRKEVISIVQYWLDKGVDGFRLDATSHIYGEGEFGLTQDTERSAQWWEEFFTAVKGSHPDCYILGEAWENIERRAQLLRGLDSALDFDVGEYIIDLVKTGGSGKVYVQNLQKIYGAYAKVRENVIDAPFLTNHDQNRVYGMVGAKPERAKMAANMLLTLPGNPIVYYGEEIGMLGAKPDEEIRSPMLWGAGDKLQASWLTSRYNKATKTVKEQENDPNSLLNHYKALIALRNSHPALLSGVLSAFDTGNDVLAAYTMQGGNETLHVIHNFTAKDQAAAVSSALKTVYQSGEIVREGGMVTLPPLSTLIVGE
jgi:alpha-amylase